MREQTFPRRSQVPRPRIGIVAPFAWTASMCLPLARTKRHVARFRFVVWRIGTGKLRPVRHPIRGPCVECFLLVRLLGDCLDERLRTANDAVVIGNDEIARKYGNPAASDGLLPADERQPC